MKYYKGCLKKEDFYKVQAAMRTINIAIMTPALGGFTENGQDYYTVDFCCGTSRLKKSG